MVNNYCIKAALIKGITPVVELTRLRYGRNQNVFCRALRNCPYRNGLLLDYYFHQPELFTQADKPYFINKVVCKH